MPELISSLAEPETCSHLATQGSALPSMALRCMGRYKAGRVGLQRSSAQDDEQKWWMLEGDLGQCLSWPPVILTEPCPFPPTLCLVISLQGVDIPSKMLSQSTFCII